MRALIAALVRRGPTVLAFGVVIGLLVPPLADLARPLMPVTVFLFVLGTLLRVEPSAVRAVARRPAVSLLLPAMTMIACPVALGIAARLAGMPYDWVVALVIAYCAPPSSGTSTIARMLSLDASVALVATLASMVFVPLTAPFVFTQQVDPAGLAVAPGVYDLAVALPGGPVLFTFDGIPLAPGDRYLAVATGSVAQGTFGLTLVDPTSRPWQTVTIDPR